MNRQLALPALLALVAPASAKVWVASDTPSLLAALSSSAHGDIVLLKSGVYTDGADFALAGKAVSLVADAGAVVELQRELVLSNLTVGANCLLQGLRLHNATSGEAALTVVGASAPLWIERCSVQNTLSPGIGPTSAAAYLVGCQRTVLHASSITGADGPSPSLSSGAVGLELFQSLVSAYGVDVRGGNGRNANMTFIGGPGGNALRAMDGQLFAQGSTLSGGNGGNGFAGVVCQPAGVGGAGADLALFQFPPPAYVLDAQVQGGAGGAGSGPCAGAAAGPAYTGATANLHILPGAARELDHASPVREGQPLTWSLDAAPGELAFLAYGLVPNLGWPEVTASGVLALQAPFDLAFVGVVPAGGTQTGGFVLHELGPGVEGAIVFAQSGYFDGASVWFGAPSATLLLDRAF